MKALISPIEPAGTGYRIAQIAEIEFEVAPPMLWVDVGQEVQCDTHYFDPVAAAAVGFPQPSHASLTAATLAKARAMRLDIFRVLDGLQASALTTGNLARASEIETCKEQLRNITAIDLSACTTREQMEVAILGAYQTIAAAAPAEIQSAFQSLVP